MRLYVMRHGPAEDRAPTGRDFDRALTVAGRAVVGRAAGALRDARAQAPARVITSPYRRARETADLVAAALGAGEAEVHPDLAADGDVPIGLVREVHAAGADAVLVGHQPTVEELVRVLVQPADPSIPSGFRTATIVALEHAAEGRWVMHALIDPHR